MRIRIALTGVLLVVAACTPEASEPDPTPAATASTDAPTEEDAPIDGTVFGFFPFPNGTEIEDVLAHFEDLGTYGDAVVVQPEVPWEDFVSGTPSEDTMAMENIRNITVIAGLNDLEPIFVVDPLNGLDRRQFIGLPDHWDASFFNPDIRTSFTGFATWLAAEFSPRYLGLSSEINTYLHAHADETDSYLDLYRTTRAAIKAVSPDTQVFVTFQWAVVHGLADNSVDPANPIPDWEQIEMFEPDLDIWAISSYPWIAWEHAADIPDDYYSRLADRTDKPLGVAEGGVLTRPTGPFPGDEQSQVDHLHKINDQLGGERLLFWINLILDDFDPQAIVEPMREQGRAESDIEGLGIFSALGLRQLDTTPKPALAVWEQFRAER